MAKKSDATLINDKLCYDKDLAHEWRLNNCNYNFFYNRNDNDSYTLIKSFFPGGGNNYLGKHRIAKSAIAGT